MGAQVIDEFEIRPQDVLIKKRRYSAFFNTDLDLTLKDMLIDTVMGVVTNICVRSTVHDVFFNGYRVVVPDDCVAATGPREQASSLYGTPRITGSFRTPGRSRPPCFPGQRSPTKFGQCDNILLAGKYVVNLSYQENLQGVLE